MEWVIFGLLFGLTGIATYGVFANVARQRRQGQPV